MSHCLQKNKKGVVGEKAKGQYKITQSSTLLLVFSLWLYPVSSSFPATIRKPFTVVVPRPLCLSLLPLLDSTFSTFFTL
ncbi:hypothetical protein K457DRAFT_846512 [Linnemannia elongata AG-77]|uniref:Uncharacterized protein n=1 Tax=Linnemannia elongata AG-77 TaxID=1314771 RepID=A0A197JGB5_9FUNG|nr:hypothetical protein K457DRAFT_846512 [Linnemannia elongata AG-77]